MTQLFATLNGTEVICARVYVPWTGIWFADIELAGAVQIGGAVQLRVGNVTFQGTVEPTRTGDFSGRTKVLVVGGKNGWSSHVSARGYHNDGQLRRNQVALDAAREAGEVLTFDAGVDKTVGVDCSRELGPASRVLEQLFPDVAWWMGTDGITRIGTRPVTDVSQKVTLLDYDPRQLTATFRGDDVAALLPGSSVKAPPRLPDPFVVHDVELRVEGSGLRSHAWGGSGRDARLLQAFRSLVREADPKRSFQGLYRYRVFEMSQDRVKVQAVRPDLGLPDQLPIDVTPGVAGAWAQLKPGAIVYVQFADGGDSSIPVVVGFEAKGGPGFLPIDSTFDASGQMKVGESSVGVELAGGAIPFAMAPATSLRIQQLAVALLDSAVSPGDGGATLQTNAKALLASLGWTFPAGTFPSIAATKVTGA